MFCSIIIYGCNIIQKDFPYLNENFCFDPLVIHTDYQVSYKVIHIRCLFHLLQALRQKCKSLELSKKKI